MRPATSTAATICLVFVSSSASCVEASATRSRARVHDQQKQAEQQLLGAVAAYAGVDADAVAVSGIEDKSKMRIRRRTKQQEVAHHEQFLDVIIADRAEAAAAAAAAASEDARKGSRGNQERYLHEGDQPWYDPDLHGDEGKHDISHARPTNEGNGDVDGPDLMSLPETNSDVVVGRNANTDMDYDEVMVTAQVMPDEYRTESPTASPMDLGSAGETAAGAAQRTPGNNEEKKEAESTEVEVCITEVCFLESTEFNVAYDKCEGTDDPESCIESSYLSWKDIALGINLPDPVGPDGDRPVGQFVTKNQSKNNRRKKVKKNKKTQGGLNDEQLIAAGTGVKGSAAFAATTNQRDRRKRKNNRKNKNNRNKMYWGDRRWKKQGKMPSDITVKIDDDMEMKLQFDLQELGLAPPGDIAMDMVCGDLSSGNDDTIENTNIKGQSTSSSPPNDGSAKPQRVPRNPVPEECRLARQIYDDAVAELLRSDEILIQKSHEMETSAVCTVGSGRYDAAKCLAVLKQVRQDIDQVMRGVSGDRDEAKKRIDKYCYRDGHDVSAVTGRPNDDDGEADSNNIQGRSPDLLPAPPTGANVNIEAVAPGPRAHSLNKDGSTPQGPSGHEVHDDNHTFPGNSSTTNDEVKTALPMLIQDRTNGASSPEARSSSLNKAATATKDAILLGEHVVPTDGPANDDALLLDVERCKSATKVLKEKRDKLQELANLQNKAGDDVDYQNIERQIGRVQQMLDETKAEKLLYCLHGEKV